MAMDLLLWFWIQFNVSKSKGAIETLINDLWYVKLFHLQFAIVCHFHIDDSNKSKQCYLNYNSVFHFEFKLLAFVVQVQGHPIEH